MNMNNVLFFSGCDSEYFELCMDLIASFGEREVGFRECVFLIWG